jgi:hypothetical protein
MARAIEHDKWIWEHARAIFQANVKAEMQKKAELKKAELLRAAQEAALAAELQAELKAKLAADVKTELAAELLRDAELKNNDTTDTHTVPKKDISDTSTVPKKDTSDITTVPKQDNPPFDITTFSLSPLGKFFPTPSLPSTPGSISELTVELSGSPPGFLELTVEPPGTPPWFPLTVDPIPIKHVPPDVGAMEDVGALEAVGAPSYT